MSNIVIGERIRQLRETEGMCGEVFGIPLSLILSSPPLCG